MLCSFHFRCQKQRAPLKKYTWPWNYPKAMVKVNFKVTLESGKIIKLLYQSCFSTMLFSASNSAVTFTIQVHIIIILKFNVNTFIFCSSSVFLFFFSYSFFLFVFNILNSNGLKCNHSMKRWVYNLVSGGEPFDWVVINVSLDLTDIQDVSSWHWNVVKLPKATQNNIR